MRDVIWTFVMLFSFDVALAQGPEPYAIIIHEILADPTPSRGLPNAEFIELRNRSGRDLDLRGIQLSNGSTTGRVSSTFLLKADSVVILCSSGSAAAFALYGRTLVLSPFPSLDNDGDTLVLLASSGSVVHAVAWEKSWYGNDVKQDGGWSLEMIDPELPCAGKMNWAASLAGTGGTPGKKNSVERTLTDTVAPWVSYAYMPDSVTLRIRFSEPLASTPRIDLVGYLVPSVSLLPPLFNEASALLNRPMPKAAVVMAEVNGITDCRGNKKTDSIRVGRSAVDARGKLVINEVLFDPPPGGADYVELYNRSDEVVDLGALFLANRNSSGNMSSLSRPSVSPYPLLPEGYVALSSDTGWLKQYYQPGTIILMQMPLPSFPDGEGNVIVTDLGGNVVDELVYSSKWHQALVSNPRGVALERLMWNKPTQDPQNWYSAASTVRFGTPGLRNSQSPGKWGLEAKVMTLSSPLISPNLDGRDDVLMIRYALPGPGWMANITVFDTHGVKRKTIANNALCGSSGFFRWEGMAENNTALPTGNYIIFGEFFSLNGERLREKLVMGIWN
jgi:hypothetical protein